MADSSSLIFKELMHTHRQEILAVLQDAFVRHAIDNRGLLTSARRASQVAGQIYELATQFLGDEADPMAVRALTDTFATQGMVIVSGMALMQAFGRILQPGLADNVSFRQEAAQKLSDFQLTFLGGLATSREIARQRSGENSQAALQRALHEQLERQRELRRRQEKLSESLRQVLQINVDLLRVTEQRLSQGRTARNMYRVLDLDVLLETAVDLILNHFDFSYAAIFMVSDVGQKVRLQAGKIKDGQKKTAEIAQFQVGDDSPVGRAIAQGEPNISYRLDQNGQQQALLPADPPLIEAAIPLVTRGLTIGALVLQSSDPEAFTDHELTTLRILADQLTSAIENARLFIELRRSEEKYRTILENIEEGYYETDLNGHFTFVNDSACNILFVPHNLVIGSNYRQFVTPGYLETAEKVFQRVLQFRIPVKSTELQILEDNEPGRYVELSALLIEDSTGSPNGFRGTIRDITKRKQAEQLLIERKALERSNRELEQFAYVASHDLQEPLNKIRLFADRLLFMNREGLDETGRDYLTRVLNATNRMQTLIDNLLTLSRVSTKGQPFVPVNLFQVATEVVSDLETRLQQTDGQIEIGELPHIEGDPLQLHQLLQNLIANALKFHRPQVSPAIKVYSSRQDLSAEGQNITNNSYYQIVVEDNGIGFDEKYLNRIFQPFQRLHGHSAYEGTGMGLAICHRIVERHGGRITARSQPGQGTLFIITLPVWQSEGMMPDEA
jgi:PAS domain S-box-containing protein